MSWSRSTAIVRASLALVVGSSLAIATDAGARPNTTQLEAHADNLLNVVVAPNPCDEVWRFLNTGAAQPTRPLNAVVSFRQSYAVSGLSTRAQVRADSVGRFALRAPLVQTGKDSLGHVDVRFSRHRTGRTTDYHYAVEVQTCSDGDACRELNSRYATPLECSTQRDSATLVVPGLTARQEVRIRFTR